MQTGNSALSQQTAGVTKPSMPSFVDRFLTFVQQLPVPYWLTYLTFFILQSGLNHVLAWIDGWLPVYGFNPILLIFPLWLWGPLAIMTYLDLISEEVLSSFSPLLDIDEERLRDLKSKFTMMPARDVILSGLIWAILYIILTLLTYDAFYEQYGLGKLITVVLILEGLINFSISSAIYNHSLRQLWLVNQTVKMVKRFNLFHLDPVYAFSHLTARTGISWMIFLGLTLLMYPIRLATGLVLAIWLFQVLLAVAAFALPLQFVNYHLVTEKRRLLAALHLRVKMTLERLHQIVDENKPGKAEQLKGALALLHTEREIITDIPTWPWRVGTLTGFLSAIVLPIILLFAQIVIERWLGK